MLSWVDQVFQVYECAKEVAAQQLPEVERRRWRCRLEVDLLAVARPCLGDKEALQHPLVQRIRAVPVGAVHLCAASGVPPRNNAAERAIRLRQSPPARSAGNALGEGVEDEDGADDALWHLAAAGPRLLPGVHRDVSGLPTAATAALPEIVYSDPDST